MTVRMYSSLDTGAPVLPNLSGTRLIDALKIVLKACLVDGFGSKPAAGWVMGHEHADGFSLGNGDGFINFVHSNNSAVVCYIMEAITDGSTALAGGVNRRSGPWFDGETTSTRQQLLSAFNGAQAKTWALVADEHTVTLLLQGGPAAIDQTEYSRAQGLHFGRWYPVVGGVGFCCVGGSTASTSGFDMWTCLTMACTVLRNPFTGLVSQGSGCGYAPLARSGLGATASQLYGQFMPRSLQLVRAGLMAGGMLMTGLALQIQNLAYCGVLRGLVYDPSICAARLSQVFPAIGVPAPVVDDRLKAHEVAGKLLWPLFPYTGGAGGFVSLDEADWEPLWT